MLSINPANGERLRTYPDPDDAAVEARLTRVHEASLAWSEASFEARSALLLAIADRLELQRESLATLIVQEMGKPVTQALAEVEKCVLVCRFFAEQAPRFLADEPVDIEGGAEAKVTYRPLGVVLAILPWNFPLWQAFRFVAPALMAGNGVVLKPAPNVMGCGLAVEQLLRDAGLPEGLVPVLGVSNERVESILRDPRIAAVTLTGSGRAGRAVAGIAGSELKKVVLELGGSDPYVVLADADLDRAVEASVRSRLNNGGQSCIGAKRIIVEASVAEVFAEKLRTRLCSIDYGDPRDPATQLGPMARADLRDQVHAQVERCIEGGARLELGGQMPEEAGFWYPLTLLTGVTVESPAFREELFGPVFTMCVARDEEHAIELANASEFGLGAAVFTRDLRRGEDIARRQLQAGSCFVNAPVRSDPRLPFGGIKQSGYGRELGRHGILEFVNAKTVWVQG
ncbi:MAG: NAD-dependent succinate-semialdehyde dehydrogenase [Nannocystaceae bacterium]|nr:NAD-dependent succinate-semialdehyde dehydrogenase [Nannocystaceae bacterium]